MPSTRRPAADAASAGASAPRILKKYPNRRLYDTNASTYITLADVKKMVLEGVEFEVRDAKTGDDLTRSILLQIILEEETGGAPMFTATMLAQIIRFYGHAMQGMMGSYLEKNLQTFVEMQARMAEQARGLFGHLHFISRRAPFEHADLCAVSCDAEMRFRACCLRLGEACALRVLAHQQVKHRDRGQGRGCYKREAQQCGDPKLHVGRRGRCDQHAEFADLCCRFRRNPG
mgnify:CR=1 FL=1